MTDTFRWARLLARLPLAALLLATLAAWLAVAASALAQADAPVSLEQKREAAMAALQPVIAGYKKLADLFPEDARFQAELARSYGYLGHLQAEAGKLEDAELTYKQVCELLKKLSSENPRVAEYHDYLFRAFSALAGVQFRAGRYNDAKENYRLGAGAVELLVQLQPESRVYREWLGATYYYAAMAGMNQGQYPEAEADLAKTIAIYRQLAQQNPAARAGLGAAYALLGDAVAMSGRWQEAADAYGDASKADDGVRVYRSRRALLQWGAGDADGYRATCAELIARHGKTDNALEAAYIVEACTVGDDALADMTPVLTLAERAFKDSNRSFLARALLGAAQITAGKTDEGIATLGDFLGKMEATAALAGPQRDAIRLVVLLGEYRLTQAFQRQNNREEADKHLAALRQLLATLRDSKPPANDVLRPWSVPLAVAISDRDLAKLAAGEK